MFTKYQNNQNRSHKGAKRHAMRKLLNLVKLGGKSAIDAVCASTGLPIAMTDASSLPKNKKTKAQVDFTISLPKRKVASSDDVKTY